MCVCKMTRGSGIYKLERGKGNALCMVYDAYFELLLSCIELEREFPDFVLHR